MSDTLTKDCKVLLDIICKEYNRRTKSGIPRREAIYFADSSTICTMFLPQQTVEDVTDTCWELCRHNYLDCHPGDNLANDIQLTDKAIAQYENRIKNGLETAVNIFSKLK